MSPRNTLVVRLRSPASPSLSTKVLLFFSAATAGQTTLLKQLFMEETPSSGHVVVCGYDSRATRPRDIPCLRRKLGIVFQDFRLLQDRSVFDNIAFALRVTGQPERSVRKRVFEVLALIGLSHKTTLFPHELSRGEQQRVCIARAIVNDPYLLLADEPTAHLDDAGAAQIIRLLQTINGRGTTVVMATHDETLIAPFPYRRIRLSRGTLEKTDNLSLLSC
jgi:cell division transport system ATP-binding protein